MDAEAAREASAGQAVEDGRFNSTEANTDSQVSTSTVERGRTLSRNATPRRSARTPPSSRMFPNPNRVTLDQGLDASMDEATIGTQRLAAEAEADNAGNGRPGEAFTWTNQPGLLIDNDMSVDDSLSGLGEDALELSNDHLPTPEELIEEAESEAAARRERSREKFSRGLTAEQEYYQAYTMLDKGLVDGEERREWQLRVQMAMDRLKREKEMQ